MKNGIFNLSISSLDMESHFIIGLRLPGSPLDNDWIVLARTLRSSNNGKGMWRSIKQAFVERL